MSGLKTLLTIPIGVTLGELDISDNEAHLIIFFCILVSSFGYVARVEGFSMKPTLNFDETSEYVFLNKVSLYKDFRLWMEMHWLKFFLL